MRQDQDQGDEERGNGRADGQDPAPGTGRAGDLVVDGWGWGAGSTTVRLLFVPVADGAGGE